MTNNPILRELYAVREQMLKKAGGDFDVVIANIQRRQAESGREILKRHSTPPIVSGDSGSTLSADSPSHS